MAGTQIGGKRAAETNKMKHGEDFYRVIGKSGGENGTTGGFGSDKPGADGLTGRERARIAGSKGGKRSRRGASMFVYREGQKFTVKEYAKKIGISYETALRRYKKKEL